MTASQLLDNLNVRGVKVWADGERVHLDAPRGTLTDADWDAVRAIKPQMLALLNRPALGTIRCPRTVRGTRLTECPFHSCGAKVRRVRTTDVYLCERCGIYFELIEPVKGVEV